MLAGLQGSGKTTLAGKLGRWLREQGHTPLLVASDLQRPNAVTQLQVVGERAGVTVFAPEPGVSDGSGTSGVSNGDPVKVARDGVAFAKDKQYDVVIVDTAGRLGVDGELMQQAADIRDATQPDEILFVVDAMIGQDAVTTALAFLEGVGFTGVVLSKLDGDARGGAALSVVGVTGKPVMFASTGEKLEDFELFHPDRMASRILDLGDVLTLIEQAEKAFDADQAGKMAAKLAADEDFTLEDFLAQMAALKNMGSLKKMLGMLPGMGELREQLENFGRPRDGPDRGDHQVDDAAGTPAAADPQRVTPAASGQGVRRPGQRRQPVDRPVRRGAEDDAPDAPRRWHARDARPARDARRRWQEGPGQERTAGSQGQGQVGQPGQAGPAGARGRPAQHRVSSTRRRLRAGRRQQARGRSGVGQPAARLREVPW